MLIQPLRETFLTTNLLKETLSSFSKLLIFRQKEQEIPSFEGIMLWLPPIKFVNLLIRLVLALYWDCSQEKSHIWSIISLLTPACQVRVTLLELACPSLLPLPSTAPTSPTPPSAPPAGPPSSGRPTGWTTPGTQCTSRPSLAPPYFLQSFFGCWELAVSSKMSKPISCTLQNKIHQLMTPSWINPKVQLWEVSLFTEKWDGPALLSGLIAQF